MSSGGREEPDAGARRAVEGWPPEAAAVALVAEAGAGSVAFDAAATLADASAGARRTLLANLSSDDGLDDHLGVGGDAGLLQLGREGLSLRDIVRRPGGREFLYLPAGRAGAGPPADHPAILRLMARTADRIRERGGRLLLFVAAGGGWASPMEGILDGVVLLGDVEMPGDASGIPVLARFPAAGEEPSAVASPGPEGGEAEAPEGGEGPSSEGRPGGALEGPVRDEEAGAWRRHRRSSGLPTKRIVVGGLVVVALAAGWWWVARRAVPEGAGPDAGGTAREAGASVPAETVRSAAGGDPERGGAGAERPAGREAAEIAAEAPELPYSVLIASYAQWPQARRRLQRWREPGGDVYFVAPTRVRGALYWRLFAGALPDRESATGLMERLVDEGRKDRARAWDVRPAGLAFRVSVGTSREEAAARAEEMSDRGLPAYVLPAASAGDTAWQVYSGGFESPEAAAELERLLDESEIEAELVPRRGERETE